MYTTRHTTQHATHTPRGTRSGFTLVELMVSIAIFAIVMTISMGTLVVLIDTNSRAQGVHSVITNISFALDSMTRNIRTGFDYYCTSSTVTSLPSGTRDCNDGDTIIFNDGETGDRVAYRLTTSNGVGVLERKIESGNWLTITSEELSITSFNIDIIGSTGSNLEQPEANILVQGYVVHDDDTDTDFTLQTRIVQRTLDY
ncbi:MAG: type II secretion system GspH family protein [Candidatus Pacebacteria bacterium]|nr:type II secretion system GspH family protein [Candidatus Paceibacterota bacterium]